MSDATCSPDRQPWLDWIRSQQSNMENLLRDWASINSGTLNRSGIDQMQTLVADSFREFSGQVEQIAVENLQRVDANGQIESLPLGPVMHASCRENAATRVLLSIHLDTVYGVDSPFQSVEQLDENTVRGPGVTDAKGGLIVMLFALRAFERYVEATGNDRVGWDVLVNSDEEIGSPGSAPVFQQFSKDLDFGLLFEPSLPDGCLISTRKGSGNFSIVVRGRAAHAGREFHRGCNAVIAAARISAALDGLNGRWPEATINVSRIDGGSPVNMVPDAAVVRFNIRYGEKIQEPEILDSIQGIIDEAGNAVGITCQLHGGFTAPPKVMTPELQGLLDNVSAAGKELGMDLKWTSTGGVCDGNRLAAWGLPNVDTLGVRGGDIHSQSEYVLLDSLAERASLVAIFLMRLAEQE